MSGLKKSVSEFDSLVFLCGFAEADLEGYRRGDWMNLKDDLQQFIFNPREDFRVVVLGGLGSLSRKDCLELQSRVKAILASAATAPLLEIGSKQPPSFTVENLSLELWSSSKNERPRFLVSGMVADVLTFHAMLLARDYFDRIKTCPKPGCGRLFFRIGRKKYCNDKCTKAEAQRAYYGRQHAPSGT